MKSLKIGVCGVGNVGGAVLENLANTPEIVASNGGVQIEIIQVGARKGKSAVPYDLDVVTDLMDVAENAEIAGKVTGKVTVSELLILKSTASIHGDISTDNLIR